MASARRQMESALRSANEKLEKAERRQEGAWRQDEPCKAGQRQKTLIAAANLNL